MKPHRKIPPRRRNGKNGWHKTQTDIGTGWSNTGKLKTSGIKDFPAAEACTTYSNNGLDDWFLPSRKELGAFYEACKTNANVKTIAPECKSGSSCLYRTSSEDTTASAWKQYFNGDGFHDFIHRAGRYRVRPVRAFM